MSENNLPKLDMSKFKMPDGDFIQEHVVNRLVKNNQPNIVLPVKESPKTKKGFELWYENNVGKIASILGILSLLLAILAVVEAWYIYKLTN